jgi:hypothetical protein
MNDEPNLPRCPRSDRSGTGRLQVRCRPARGKGRPGTERQRRSACTRAVVKLRGQVALIGGVRSSGAAWVRPRRIAAMASAGFATTPQTRAMVPVMMIGQPIST